MVECHSRSCNPSRTTQWSRCTAPTHHGGAPAGELPRGERTTRSQTCRLDTQEENDRWHSVVSVRSARHARRRSLPGLRKEQEPPSHPHENAPCCRDTNDIDDLEMRWQLVRTLLVGSYSQYSIHVVKELFYMYGTSCLLIHVILICS